MSYWKKLNELPSYSFVMNAGGVKRVKDAGGSWVERSEVQTIVSSAESRISYLEMHLSNAKEFAKAGRWDIVKNILDRVDNE